VKFGHDVSHCQCSKICPKLPKSSQRQSLQETLKFHHKLRFWFFSRKTSMCRGDTKAWAHSLVFNLRVFHMCLFNVKKRPLYVNFSTPLCAKWCFFKVPHVTWIWDFVDMYLTHLRTRIWSPLIHTYSKKWFFLAPPKLCCTPWA
jgi:hypothetical protein